jgi:hypothetical protein
MLAAFQQTRLRGEPETSVTSSDRIFHTAVSALCFYYLWWLQMFSIEVPGDKEALTSLRQIAAVEQALKFVVFRDPAAKQAFVWCDANLRQTHLLKEIVHANGQEEAWIELQRDLVCATSFYCKCLLGNQLLIHRDCSDTLALADHCRSSYERTCP